MSIRLILVEMLRLYRVDQSLAELLLLLELNLGRKYMDTVAVFKCMCNNVITSSFHTNLPVLRKDRMERIIIIPYFLHVCKTASTTHTPCCVCVRACVFSMSGWSFKSFFPRSVALVVLTPNNVAIVAPGAANLGVSPSVSKRGLAIA